MPNEHERSLGGWQSEWETLPEIVSLCAAALAHLRSVIDGLHVDTERMRRNIDASRGMVMAESVTLALAKDLGRAQAHQVVETACHKAYAENRDLLAVLQEQAQVIGVLSPQRLAQLFDPLSYIGEAGNFVDRVIQAYQQRKG
jgi:3-carboxy-cis,cis-muconate cycloisomerase